MADYKNKRSSQDSVRINVHEGYEVGYCTHKWGVPRDQLEAAAKEIGASAAAVAKDLGC